MASQADIKRAKELLKIEQEIKEVRSADLATSFSSLESLKEVLNIKSRSTEFEKAILKNAKDLNSAILNQKKSFSSISELQRDITKNTNLLNKSLKLTNEIEAGISPFRKLKIKDRLEDLKVIERLRKETKELQDQEAKAGAEERKSLNFQIKSKQDTLAANEDKYYKRVKFGLTASEKELLLSKVISKELKVQNDLRDEALEKIEPASQFLQILGAIPGFSGIATEAMTKLLSETEEVIEKGGDGIDNIGQLTTSLKTGFDAVTSPISLIIASVGILLKNFNELSTAQTEFVRQTGQVPVKIGLLNDGLVTSVDLIKTQVALTEQLGINSAIAFSPATLQTASELTKAVGLSADASGNFARFSKITGTNLENSLDALTQSVPKAFSQQKILEETANVSSDIAVSLGNSVTEIGDAVIKANQLGLSLQQVNDIAGSLLDIESSIAAEFEAEVITGKQLNLERARFFALTNDLAGLTDEIANNQEVISSFANANRIEQEAIAGALGMSREQMADMVLQSDLINTLTEKQRANAAGVTLDQLKQLDAQQALNDAVAKFAQALIPGVQLFTEILNLATRFGSTIGGVVAGITAFKAISSAIFAIEKARLAISKKQTLQEAAQAAIKTIGNPIALAGGLIAGGLAFAAAKKYITQTGDAIIPAGKGPIISTREGGLIQGTANDDVVMAPGIARGGRNAGLSQTDVAAIAKAVRDGASQAQINLDGGRVSNRLQPSLAVNTRKYSI